MKIGKQEQPASADSGHDTSPDTAEPILFIAVVHSTDGICFRAVARTRRELLFRIADYVDYWSGYLLHPKHGRQLRALLARGETEAAVELYFGLVGERWEKEWLVTAVVPTTNLQGVVAVMDEVAVPDASHDVDAIVGRITGEHEIVGSPRRSRRRATPA